jgi:hypothetical protein
MPDVNYAFVVCQNVLNDGASNASNFTTTSIDRDTNSINWICKNCAGRT